MNFVFGGAVFSPLLWGVRRSVRPERIELDDAARSFIEEAAGRDDIHIVAHRRRVGKDPEEYARKLREQCEGDRVLAGEPVLFLEVDAKSTGVLKVRGADVGGFRVLRAEGSNVPDTIAAFLLYLRDTTGAKPRCYFGWKEDNPATNLLISLLFGRGDIALLTCMALRKAEPDRERRPIVHAGGQ